MPLIAAELLQPRRDILIFPNLLKDFQHLPGALCWSQTELLEQKSLINPEILRGSGAGARRRVEQTLFSPRQFFRS
jgi:hypothetical protein